MSEAAAVPTPSRSLWGQTEGEARRRPLQPGDVLRVIARARRTAALYGAGHPVVASTMREAHGILAGLVAAGHSLRLAIHEDTFYVERTVLLEESLQLYALLLDLREREVGVLEFHAGVEVEELQHLVEVLNLPAAELRRGGGASHALARRGVRHITVGPAPAAPEELRLRVDPRDAYRAGLRVADELTFQASRGLPLEMRKARMVVNSLVDIIMEDRAGLLGISALRAYDEDTAHHSLNVAVLALLMAERLNVDRARLIAIGLAGLLHDIGKVRVPREILLKAAALTPEEQVVMRRHPVYGAHLLRNLPGLARVAFIAAFEHHANYDLSGYPRIGTRRFPHLVTRIVQIADFFDAATSARRPYHRPMAPVEAMRFILDKAGTIFDPVLARIFVHALGLYPVGSLVELDTGELGVVLRPGERELTRPVLRVVQNRFHDPIAPYTLDLEDDPERHIVRAVDPEAAGIDPTAHLQVQ
ncbi:MAG: HD-GYP domain-containing protein [Armatimonadota bacterium]|nr:HD-GYP domain-containing protein [Armatimonadota bacterium]MDR7450128.1 HD-GYP domain-containing protein [Armatimonadota bacterium]MDR7460612.1 HD-GYP domain-containing protein [Armatimonadota bacterium]MDR7480839.1 HD-GYP domain-containing protein [Armatimonadota bacterium]MDR7489508.1 HD-GYP domain-containing protein [Armatimonadota bacterium]